MNTRRNLAAILLSMGLGVIFSPIALAQNYPTKPIKIVVAYPPGGGTDYIGRLLAQKLSEEFGQPAVVENVAGASGAIGAQQVAKATPDGHTLLLITSNETIQPALRKQPYDLETDLTAVSLVAIGPQVLVVNPKVAATGVQELMALARAQPGKLTFGSPGIGTSPHIAGEVMKALAKVDILHVPYKGSAETVTAVVSGEVDMGFATPTAVQPFLQSKQLKAFAVTTAQRAASLPDVPSFNESGLTGFDRPGWYGVSAPAGTPKEVITRLHAAIVKVAGTPEAKEALRKQGLEAHTNTPETFAAMIHREREENGKLLGAMGTKDQ